MRQVRRRRRPWRVFAGALILTVCALIAVRWGWGAAGRLWVRRQPVALPRPSTVEADTKLIWVTTYTVCGDEERRESAPDSAMIGQTLEQLQAANPGWRVESFAREQVVLRRNEQLCPLHRDNRTLKIKDGALVIYYGTPDRLGPEVRAVPDVVPTSLADDDRALLEKGLLFTNSDPSALEEMISSYLEGITE